MPGIYLLGLWNTLCLSGFPFSLLLSFTLCLWCCCLSCFISVLPKLRSQSFLERNHFTLSSSSCSLSVWWMSLWWLLVLQRLCCRVAMAMATVLGMLLLVLPGSETMLLGHVQKPLSFSYSLLKRENATLGVRLTHPLQQTLCWQSLIIVHHWGTLLCFLPARSRLLTQTQHGREGWLNGPLSNKH